MRQDQHTKFSRPPLVDLRKANSLAVLIAISVVYFAVTVAQASNRLLWFDEFITFYIAKLNSYHSIWAALREGVDPNPPLTHVLVMWSMRLFGDGELAVRLPAIIAGWIGVTCLYVFLRKRVPAPFAIAGVLYLLGTAAMDYSYEARSYALTLAFAMLSLVAWRASVEGRHPVAAACGLAVALAAGISSNYFAVLAFFPVAAGELVRNIESRKFEWRVWVAMAAGAVPLLLYMPLIEHSIAQFSPYAFNRPRLGVVRDSYVQMVAVNLIPALVIFAVAIGLYVMRRIRRIAPSAVLPRHEWAAVLMLLLYPVLGYVIAILRAGMISPRFVLPVCYGFAIAVAVTGYKLFVRSQTGTVALLLFLAVSFAVHEGLLGLWFYSQRLAVYRVRDRLPDTDVVAVSDSLLVLPLHHYSPPKLASRIVFPVDFDAVRRYKHEDSPEQNLWAGRNVFPVPVVSLREFEANTPDYLIVTTRENWLIQKLHADGSWVTELDIPTNTRAIGGFFPLSHGEIHYFEKESRENLTVFASVNPPTGRRELTHGHQPSARRHEIGTEKR